MIVFSEHAQPFVQGINLGMGRNGRRGGAGRGGAVVDILVFVGALHLFANKYFTSTAKVQTR